MARERASALSWGQTLLYPALLVALFLGLQLLAQLLGVPSAQRAALAAPGALLALLLSLPGRLRRRWQQPEPWRALGVTGPPALVLRALVRGLLKAVVLLALVLIALALTGRCSGSRD